MFECIALKCCCFFVFKHKTTYEMRISDWSSDVCSSDLPARVPDDLPPSPPLGDPAALAAEAARDYGIEPEFFGNSVLNDTSLVLLVEADIGGVPKRMLFTGDLQTFTYLMANHPTGIGQEEIGRAHV